MQMNEGDAELDEPLRVRQHRARSWLARAERERDDPDAAFLFLWIAFNAAYAHEFGYEQREREQARAFLDRLVAVDQAGRLQQVLFQQFSGPIRTLIDNRFVYAPFWQALREHDSSERWRERFDGERKRAIAAMIGGHTGDVLAIVLDRLYVLRNQLVHGGATWNSRVNRQQVGDGVRILAAVLPVLLDLMRDHPSLDLGAIAYPVLPD